MVLTGKEIICGDQELTIKRLKQEDRCLIEDDTWPKGPDNKPTPPADCYNPESKTPYTRTSEVCIKPDPTGKPSKDCLNGLAFISCVDKLNQCIKQHNDWKDGEWAKRRDNVIKQGGTRDQWNQRSNQIFNDKRNERHHQCDGCPADWGEIGNLGEDGCGKGHSRRICQKHEHVARDEADRQTAAERGNRPEFKEPEPTKTQNVSTGSVSCCNNVVNVVNGQIQNTNITQTCAAGTDDNGNQTGSKDTNNFDNSGKQTTTQEDTFEAESEEGEGDNKKMMIFIALFILFALCSSIAVVLLLSDDE
jgi:hypothetical protein